MARIRPEWRCLILVLVLTGPVSAITLDDLDDMVLNRPNEVSNGEEITITSFGLNTKSRYFFFYFDQYLRGIFGQNTLKMYLDTVIGQHLPLHTQCGAVAI